MMQATFRPHSPASWSSALRHDPDVGYIVEQKADQKALLQLQALLTGLESPWTVAQTIATIYEPVLEKDSSGDGYGCHFWAIICYATRQFGGSVTQAERLATLLQHIAALPDVTTDKNGQVFWRDLPQFGFNFREHAVREIYSEMRKSFLTPLEYRCAGSGGC